ncbi:hypothetical protein [Porphyromonas sp.]|uniref:hypothetical protein n=1 Tax=Porphyromonas sp. TaxID=1924944 RepID=UPI0026DD667A|nr:hypothetical protein [Porphyromonas sp.]MDO4695807.1 hypothetical protein [Porphyromonas sp.]MDO4771787.1 hypothetical protein [Porphyromonas sp.]
MNNYIKPEVRLQMRKANLELRAQRSRERLIDNMEYAKSNVVNVVGREVVDAVGETSPFVAKVLSRFLPSDSTRKDRYSSRATSGESSSWIWGTLKGGLLPLIFGITRHRLLSFSLRRTGGILRFILKRLFRLVS